MKISIKDIETKSNVVMKLYLEEDDDIIFLRATDKADQIWTIAEFSDRGMELWTQIEEKSGWPITKDGVLKHFIQK